MKPCPYKRVALGAPVRTERLEPAAGGRLLGARIRRPIPDIPLHFSRRLGQCFVEVALSFYPLLSLLDCIRLYNLTNPRGEAPRKNSFVVVGFLVRFSYILKTECNSSRGCSFLPMCEPALLREWGN